jgi:hypothetical protein
MSNDLRISYLPLPDATPESELEALAAVYSFLIQSHVNREAATTGGGNDHKKGGEEACMPGPPGVARTRLPAHPDELRNWRNVAFVEASGKPPPPPHNMRAVPSEAPLGEAGPREGSCSDNRNEGTERRARRGR